MLIANQKEFRSAMKEKTERDRKSLVSQIKQDSKFKKNLQLFQANREEQRLFKFLQTRELLKQFARPLVRKCFEEGTHGAPVRMTVKLSIERKAFQKLSQTELDVISDLNVLFNQPSEGCSDQEHFFRRLTVSSKELTKILKENGCK